MLRGRQASPRRSSTSRENVRSPRCRPAEGRLGQSPGRLLHPPAEGSLPASASSRRLTSVLADVESRQNVLKRFVRKRREQLEGQKGLTWSSGPGPPGAASGREP
ncbi:hypothetical protein VULLAG_LOCUS14429 [Vulpes lagopus]